MIAGPAPTDQRAGIRPITFVLDDGQFQQAVTLPIRPEDLTRTEPSRATVHQTLGREVAGWVDNFGAGLPSVTISGNTGWRYAQGIGRDGFQSFDDLNQLVAHNYHEAKQAAIDSGNDPAMVKLLFVDVLDHFAWSVVPMQFVLRRSKSRPLLFQYNITLQAIATTIDVPNVEVPNYGNSGLGMSALGDATSTILGNLGGISPLDDLLAGLSDFVEISTDIFGAVTSDAMSVLGIASDMAIVGQRVFRTLSSALNLPLDMMERAARIAAAYNSAACIFANALRPRPPYEEYSSLYGTSNCSSTTGGSPQSIYAGMNVFELMQPDVSPIDVSSAALASIKAIKTSDPVLAPMSLAQLGGHLANITAGVTP